MVEYHHWMRTQCFKLQLCEGNWKADRVAILANYSQWIKKYEARLERSAAVAKAAKRKARKGKERSTAVMDDEDRDFQQESDGATMVGAVLASAPFRVLPVPDAMLSHALLAPDGLASASGAAGPSRTIWRSTSLSGEEPVHKRQRTETDSDTSLEITVPPPHLPSPPSSVHAAISHIPPQHGTDNATIQESVNAPEPLKATNKPIVRMSQQSYTSYCDSRNLNWGHGENMTWATAAESTPNRSTPPTAESIISLPLDPPAAESSSSIVPPTVDSAVAAVSTPVTALDLHSKKAKARPQPRKVTCWPPPDDKEHAKPKDVCAHIWAHNNPEGTCEEYNLWYKRTTPYQRQMYAANGGVKAKTDAVTVPLAKMIDKAAV
ncbi:hypothetical protein C2E23DRAFT_883121 [Lenzites betulinus]|nr:hypothetical protein C2E23DRAFT_883121 [Lenzites betulinus]